MGKSSKELEIDFRGESIFFTSKIESWLGKIVLFIKWEHPELGIKKIDFKHFTFYQKIEKVEKLLRSHYEEIFKANDGLFAELQNVRLFRNRVAHCEFTWNEEDLSYFEVWDIEENEEKDQFFVPIKYTIEQAISEMDSMVKAGNSLLSITAKFQSDFNEKLANGFYSQK